MNLKTFSREFPLKSIQCGAALGNGYTGILLWGGGNTLNVTIGCANLWDHRGGLEWDERQNFRDIRAALETREIENVLRLFESPDHDMDFCPTLIPTGRVVVTLPEGCELLHFEQVFTTGITTIFYCAANGSTASFEFAADLSMKDAVACRNLPQGSKLELIPAWHLSLAQGEASLKEARGFSEPACIQLADAFAFTQPMPVDPAYNVICRHNDSGFVISMQRGDIDVASWQTGSQEDIFAASAKWFGEYFASVPFVECGDAELDEIYWHGMYKYGIMTNPAGIPPGLQGPWIEDDSLPPWSGDYHFNINVQLCNSPGFKAGKFTHLKPLFDLVLTWKEKLRHNARCFAGIEDGYMLPNSVDDRGLSMGNFWCGAIDHACTAWTSNMMFDYCEYSGDTQFLRDHVYDFMLGVLRVYWKMFERNEDGTLSMPVSVSPEYGEASINAWGRNASFQFAAAHRLAENLIRAAEILGIPCEAGAVEIREKLPMFCLEDEQIAIWEGEILSQSHRHHSHLACIYPFSTIDPQDEKYAEIVKKSIVYWTARGMGQWTGWCIPWASQIHSRVGNPEMAQMTLKIWRSLFTNAGGGSLHDSHAMGFTFFAKIRKEIMQMDGAMGSVNAIQDLFIHQCGDVLRAFYGFPERAPASSFENMVVPGFKVSGSRDSRSASLTITATRDGDLALQMPGTALFKRTMKAGETLRLARTADNMLAEISA